MTLIDAIREVAESSLGTIEDAARTSRFKPSIFLETDASATDVAGISGNADVPTGSADALKFTDRAGRRILPSGATPITPTGPIPPSAVPYQHPLGQRLDPGAIHFTPPRPHTPPATPRGTDARPDVA